MLHSYHNFLFPFRFDKIIKTFSNKHEYYKDESFDERVKIDIDFKNSLEKNGWVYEKFRVKDNLDYNELVYFHDFIQDSLFNTADFEQNATSYYFTKEVENSSYDIKIKDEEPYQLKLCGINLRIFDTGVGILSFEVENHDYSHIKDIFNINEYGRRIYPQFLDADFEVNGVRDAFLPEYIEVNGVKEEFSHNYKDIKLANFILQILGNTFSEDKSAKDRYFLQPLLDDRMYVVSHILNKGFSDSIKKEFTDNWYEYVFVDKHNAKNIQDKEMQKELINNATYTRWKDWGTLYGITRYSFVLLTDSGDYSNVLLKHMQTLYFQMITLSLATRASILRFSDEVTAISDIEPNKDTVGNIANLYKNYLRFKNKLYFKEITPQEQGIELYDKMREIMRIDKDIEDISNEIMTLNSYAFMLQEKEEKEEMGRLTKLGTIFLPGTFIAGIFGMNSFPDGWINNFGGLAFSFGLIICISWFIAKRNKIDLKKFIKEGKL